MSTQMLPSATASKRFSEALLLLLLPLPPEVEVGAAAVVICRRS